MAKDACDLTLLGSKQGPPSCMGLQSNPDPQTKSMLACNAASLASTVGIHHFLSSSPAVGAGAVGDTGAGPTLYKANSTAVNRLQN